MRLRKFPFFPLCSHRLQTIPRVVVFIRNLQGDLGKPVAKDEPGVAIVSGFSPNMLKAFLEEGKKEDVQAEPESDKMVADAPEANAKTKLTPEENMLKILGHESFANLKVFD